MISLNDKRHCCGCHGCAQICPQLCISMVPDDQGFVYPRTDEAACTGCGQCERVCPTLHRLPPRTPADTFAAINPDREARLKSSSGGVFTLLAERTIGAGGVVYGAQFDRQWQVVHAGAETPEAIEPLRGSKYVQSDMGDCYRQVQRHLQQGRKVLFTGTPCQVAGLRQWLRRDDENLLLADIVCHGVPSPAVWRSYLSQQGRVHTVNFRDKRTGWRHYSATINNRSKPYDRDNFMRCFLADLTLRPSCFDCPAKAGRSGSDLTLGDLWGAEQLAPRLHDDTGISLAMAYTDKGRQALGQLGLVLHQVDYAMATAHNPMVAASATVPEHYAAFWRDYARHPQKALSQWGRKQGPSLATRLKQLLHQLIR